MQKLGTILSKSESVKFSLIHQWKKYFSLSNQSHFTDSVKFDGFTVTSF